MENIKNMELKKDKESEFLQIRISKDLKEEIYSIAEENDTSAAKLLEYCFNFWKNSVDFNKMKKSK